MGGVRCHKKQKPEDDKFLSWRDGGSPKSLGSSCSNKDQG